MNKKRGITLIALIITIIVLLILAGVSVSMVVGENGIVGRAVHSSEVTRKADAKERVLMEVAGSYDETGKINLKDLNDNLRNNLENVKLKKGENSYEFLDDGENQIKELPVIVQYKGVEVEISGSLSSKEEILPSKTKNLSEVAIGSYVDIGITYENVVNGYTDITEKLTGWRILDNTESEVKVISAGCPLTYYLANGGVESSIQKLENLYTTITLDGESDISGFVNNGFENNNLQKVFSENNYVDTAKGVHAFSCSTNYNDGTGAKVDNPLPEIETLYNKITGTSIVMNDLCSMHNTLKTSSIKEVAGDKWKESYNYLLEIGLPYWVGGSSLDDNKLWLVGVEGGVSNMSSGYKSVGVRPVITLKSGVKVDVSQDEDGLSEVTAYKLTQ